jgi:RNA polymerase sigma factor (sigma-70 family)
VLSCVEPGAETIDTSRPAERLPSNSEQDFRYLYRTHFDEVMRFVLRFGVRSHDAEDLVQRVFMVALRRSAEAEPIQQSGAWLRAVALRIVQQHYRFWRVRRAAQWLLEQTSLGVLVDDLNPEREADANESLRQVRHVLGKMSAKLRDALVLLDLQGLEPREAAAMLGIPYHTMRSRHLLARVEFKRLWDIAERKRNMAHD